MGILKGYYEKDIESMIMSNVKDMPSRGLDIFYRNTKRQVKTPLDGIIDIITWEVVDEILFVRVIEIKKDAADTDALSQGANYCNSIAALKIKFKEIRLELVLIGKDISEGLHSASILLVNCRVFTYDFNFAGLYFTESMPATEYTCEELKSILGSHKEDFLKFADFFINPNNNQ